MACTNDLQRQPKEQQANAANGSDAKKSFSHGRRWNKSIWRTVLTALARTKERSPDRKLESRQFFGLSAHGPLVKENVDFRAVVLGDVVANGNA